jgi:hypothetical protein
MPGTSVAFDELCFQLVLQAQQRGLVNESFFDQLIEERSGQAERIHVVAAQGPGGRAGSLSRIGPWARSARTTPYARRARRRRCWQVNGTLASPRRVGPQSTI